jgi:ribosomal protein S18 acetylase RimI-like enzyme
MPVLLADLANPDHQAAIIDLLDMYCRDEFGDKQPLSDQARTDLIPGLVHHGLARVFLAYDDTRPVGLAICFVGFSSFRAKPLLNIHDIAVRPETRGQGIGRQLLKAIEEDARALGCCKLTLEVRADNLRAQALYKDVGFQPTDPGTWFWTRPLT